MPTDLRPARATGQPGGLQPQFATAQDAVISSVDWLVEPCWTGTRLLARFADGGVTFTDRSGAPCGQDLVEAERLLAAAMDARTALIDGIWTPMPFLGSSRSVPGRDVDLPDRDGDADPERRTFVAWDLVELDGAALHDVPLQERRRLLESVIAETARVRISPAVRVPLDRWLVAWQRDGFTHVIAKHMNSRYRHGATAEDWLQVPIHGERQPGILARLFGQRPRRVRRIDD